jgi:hypothetical protein
MQEYTYSGPLSGVSLTEHGDVMLVPGSVVRLPVDHEYTARLARKGWLQEVAPTDPQAEPIAVAEAAEENVVTDKKRRK